jgi:hypothetical protein
VRNSAGMLLASKRPVRPPANVELHRRRPYSAH